MVSYGFYNSVNGDRKYSSIQFGEMFDGLISDGIYPNIGNKFQVIPGSGLSVRVKSGRAWFNHTWTDNSTDFPLDLDYADLLLPRYDTIALQVDTRVSVRENAIVYVKGEASINPVKPLLVNDGGLYLYPLAHIYIGANVNTVTSSNIENVVGTSACPYVSAKLELLSITNAFAQFEQQFVDWLDSVKDLADESVFVALKFQLDEAEAKLTASNSQVDDLKAQMNRIETALNA